MAVAKKNAKNHEVDIQFLHGNLLEPILNDYGLWTTDYSRKTDKNSNIADCSPSAVGCGPIVITANLPYLTKKWHDSEPSIRHEPRIALVADDKDGLTLYEKLLSQIQQLTTDYRLRTTALLEIDPRQSEAMRRLAQKYLPDFSFEIKKDLAGRNRLAIIERLKD